MNSYNSGSKSQGRISEVINTATKDHKNNSFTVLRSAKIDKPKVQEILLVAM
jgi:hypothetical protein